MRRSQRAEQDAMGREVVFLPARFQLCRLQQDPERAFERAFEIVFRSSK